MPFIPDDFVPPRVLFGDEFRLEVLAEAHNARDHEAWMSSIDHIRSTPGMQGRSWPSPMTLEQNLADMTMHREEFEARTSFTYSVLDGDDVIGCVYIYPDDGDHDAHVRSWVRADRVSLDSTVREVVRQWLSEVWPFESIRYARAQD